MNIRFYKESDKPAWDRYVNGHPDGTFFHLTGWKKLVEKAFGHKSRYLIAESESIAGNGGKPAAAPRIAGVFPLFPVKSVLFGKSMVSLPFATYGGILSDNEQARDALFRKAAELTASDDMDYLEIRSQNAELPGLPVKNLYCAFKREISSDRDVNLTSIPRKTRRMVRQGMKNGLQFAFGGLELLDRFYELFSLSYHAFGTPVFSRKYIKRILEVFKESSSVLIVSKNGTPLSGVLSFYYKDQIIPYYSGSRPSSREYAANDYLYWVLMCDAAEKGCAVFDFGRSKKDTGPYHFKRHWGFEPKPLGYQYFLHGTDEIPNISPSNPKYQKSIVLWKKLPLWATKLIGPRIVKYIP